MLVTLALLGSALLTLAVGAVGHRLRETAVLAAATLLMLGTGLGFALLEGFAALCVVAFAGTLNPSGGDVSVFLPAALPSSAASTKNPQPSPSSEGLVVDPSPRNRMGPSQHSRLRSAA